MGAIYTTTPLVQMQQEGTNASNYFFAVCNPTNPTPTHELHPDWKVQGTLRYTLF